MTSLELFLADHSRVAQQTMAEGLFGKPLEDILAGALARFPLMTCKVLGAIYWQAFRLWWTGVPFYPHPRRISPQPTNPGAAGQ